MFRRRAKIAIAALTVGSVEGCGESVIDQAIERACDVITTCNAYDEAYEARCVQTARRVADDDGRPLQCATAYARYLLCVYDIDDCSMYSDPVRRRMHVEAECFDELATYFECER